MKNPGKLKIVCGIFGIGILTCGGFYLTQKVWAGGGSGTGLESTGAGCSAANTTTWCGSAGVSWRKYPVTEAIPDGNEKYEGKKPTEVCAGKTEYYYQLAYEQVVTAESGKISKYLNIQGAPVNVDQVNYSSVNDSAAKGSYIFLDDTTPLNEKGPDAIGNLSGTMSWNDVKTAWNAIPSADRESFAFPDWGDVSWFCWDDAWENKDITEDASGTFESASGVKINEQGIGYQESGRDGKVTVKLSTDQAEFSVDFTHKMYYSGTYEKAETTLSYQGAEIKDGDGGKFGVEGKEKLDTDGATTKTQAVNIKLNPGETKTVCQSIGYSPKNVKVQKSGKGDKGGNLIGDWTYGEVSGEGSGGSTACVEVYRPKNPGDNGDGPTASGSGTSSVWFAGETANLGWTATANATETRRVVQYQPVGFLLKDTVARNVDNLRGAFGGSSSDPCAYYRSKIGAGNFEYCNNLETGGTKSGISDDQKKQGYTISEELSVVVPDGVGYKYCNSLGFKWEYWWGVQQGDGDTDWHHVNQDYWTNYDAVCRTIAKKPSFAVWNGSVFSDSNIATTLAQRADTSTMGIGASTIASNSDAAKNKTTYGSWVEHSLISNGSVYGFSSGASLARGRVGALTTSVDDSLSSLTIANSNLKSLGNADVQLNKTTFITRLVAYLENNQEVEKVSEITGLNGLGKGDMKVYVAEGDLKITGNISNAGTYQNIYEIPQVIIFAEKDDAKIDISGDVTRIDAWIIAPNGTINTCSDLTSSVGTRTLSYNTNTICDKQLQINGPVIAKNLKLNRTFGADGYSYGGASQKYTPSEIFNLSGASYLWAYAQSGRYSSSYSEAYSRELAPRY